MHKTSNDNILLQLHILLLFSFLLPSSFSYILTQKKNASLWVENTCYIRSKTILFIFFWVMCYNIKIFPIIHIAGGGNFERMKPSLNSFHFKLPLLFYQRVCTLPILSFLIKSNLKKNSFWEIKVVFKNSNKQKQLFKS